MDYWLGLFLSALLAAGMMILGIMKYVDDVNVICTMIALGTCWSDGTLVHSKVWEAEDKTQGLTQEHVTITALRDAADAMIPWLSFTSDVPSLHASMMVPMLDLQVWVRPADPKDEEDYNLLG